MTVRDTFKRFYKPLSCGGTASKISAPNPTTFQLLCHSKAKTMSLANHLF